MNLLIIIFTARILGAEGRGEITYLITCIGLLQVFTAIVGNSVMVFMLTKYQQKEILISSFLWTLFIAVIALPFVFFITKLSITNLLYFVLLGIIQTGFNNLTALYSYQLKFRLLTILKIIQPLILLILIFAMSTFEILNTNIYWQLLIISFLPHFGFLLFETFRKNQKITFHSLMVITKHFLKLGGLNQLNNLMQFASYRFAVLIIMRMLSVKDVGIFGLWLTVTDSIWLIPVGLANVNMAYATKSNYSVKSILKYILASLAVSLSLIITILLIPNDFFVWLLGKDFTALKSLILISSPVICLFTINIIIANFFSAKGLIKYNTISSGLGFISITSITALLTAQFGLKGAVMSNCISYFISIVVTLILFYRNSSQFNSNSIPIN